MSSISLKGFPKVPKKRPYSGGQGSRKSFTSEHLSEDLGLRGSEEKVAKTAEVYPVIELAPNYSDYPCAVNAAPVVEAVRAP